MIIKFFSRVKTEISRVYERRKHFCCLCLLTINLFLFLLNVLRCHWALETRERKKAEEVKNQIFTLKKWTQNKGKRHKCWEHLWYSFTRSRKNMLFVWSTRRIPSSICLTQHHTSFQSFHQKMKRNESHKWTECCQRINDFRIGNKRVKLLSGTSKSRKKQQSFRTNEEKY